MTTQPGTKTTTKDNSNNSLLRSCDPAFCSVDRFKVPTVHKEINIKAIYRRSYNSVLPVYLDFLVATIIKTILNKSSI